VAILEGRGVTKAYGGLLAVRDVSFSVETGEILAIAGPNGAGKTTLFDTLSGLAPATSGTILFEEREIQRLPPDDICRLGLARTFQTAASFPTQTVLANALVGATFGRAGAGRPALAFPAGAVESALDALESCGLLERQSEPAGTLSVYERKRLMLATALAARPRVLLLDEPVGGLNKAERESFVELVRRVHATGVTILLIEHVMKAVLALATRMMVLHHGERIAEGRPAEVLRDRRVVDVYLGGRGRELAEGA
jgi:branched-chain amino acid transport system ATP-binding protein